VAGSALGAWLGKPGVRVSCQVNGSGSATTAQLQIDYTGLERSPERELASWARQFGECGSGEYVTQCRGTGCWDLAIEAAGSHGNGTVTVLAKPNGSCAVDGSAPHPKTPAEP